MSISIDLSGLDKKIAEKAAAMKKSLGQAMREEGGLLCLPLMKYTQPFGMNGKAKSLGEGAILRDLTEVFYILPDELCAGRTIIHDNGIYEGYVQIFAKKTGELFICPPENWHVVDPIDSLHDYWQTLRTQDGRVRRNRNKLAQDGRVRIIQLWVITKSQGDQLWGMVSPKVGYAKNGWAQCAKKLGRSNSEVPAWIKNHDAPATVIDNTDKPRPTLTLANEVNYTGRVLSESNKRAAIREREKLITLAIDRAVKFGVKDK
jgi:hypothetical protein